MYDFTGNQDEWSDPSNDPWAMLAARIIEPAYEVALKHGVRGSFADLELDLWQRIQSVVAATNPTIGRGSHHGDAA